MLRGAKPGGIEGLWPNAERPAKAVGVRFIEGVNHSEKFNRLDS